MTNKTKVHGVPKAVEVPPTGGRGDQRRVTRGDTYAEESDIGTDIHGDTGVIGFRAPVELTSKICRLIVVGNLSGRSQRLTSRSM